MADLAVETSRDTLVSRITRLRLTYDVAVTPSSRQSAMAGVRHRHEVVALSRHRVASTSSARSVTADLRTVSHWLDM